MLTNKTSNLRSRFSKKLGTRLRDSTNWPICCLILSRNHLLKFRRAELKRRWKLWVKWFPQNKKRPLESEKISIHISLKSPILSIGILLFISGQQIQTLNLKENVSGRNQILFLKSSINRSEELYYQKRSANRFRRSWHLINPLLRKWTIEPSGYSQQLRVRVLNQQKPLQITLQSRT